MTRTIQTHTRPLILAALAAIALPLLAPVSAHAQAANGGSVTVRPGGFVTQSGFRTAVVAATAINGDAAAARNAMMAANVALSRSPGFIAVPASEVAAAFNSMKIGGTMIGSDYQALGKRLKAQRAMTVTVTPGEMSDTEASYTALVEMYDTANGGLVGRGQGTFTATEEALAADTAALKTPPANVAPSAQVLPTRALSGAIYRAINELNKPATFRGVVISIPGAYLARLSIGERNGLRNGARVVYLDAGQPLAYGTVIDVGSGEAVATVAPEAGVTGITANTEFRTLSNPTADRAGKSAREQDEAEFRNFERQFGLALAVAGIAYYAFR